MDDDHLFQGDAPTRSVGPTLGDVTGADPNAPPLLGTGDDFGPYHVVRLLGRGGMGEVYEVEDRDNARRVALKVLSNRLSGPADRARFIREGRLAAGISHPNTVYVYGTDDIDGIPVIAMELAPGGTLKDRVKMKGQLPPSQAVDAILQVVAGLEAAADAGVMHRDIKPSNCFVDSDGTVKVGDFGLSISTQMVDERSLTMLGTVLGTPGFSSPEQLRGDDLDLRSDIYSVGATLYYLLTARAPFDDPNVIRLVTQVAQEMPPSPRVARPDVPADLADVVMRCLAKRPADRYQTYDALREALEPFSSNAPAPGPLGIRLGAGVVDQVILTLISTPIASVWWGGFQPTDRTRMMLGIITGWVVLLLYYGISEGLWGRSPGKWLFGLRVVDALNHRPGLARGFLRAGAWIVANGLPILAYSVWLMPYLNAYQNKPLGALLGLSIPAMNFLVLLVIFSTARRHNGNAGVHDLMTGTRVILHRRVQDRLRSTATTGEPLPVSKRERIGPYVVLDEHPLGITDLVTGYDDRLRRRVWIHRRHTSDPMLSQGRRGLARPGRLRWLGGRRAETDAWDAYEAPEGVPLGKALEVRRSWAEVRYWLLDLATEIRAARADGTTLPLSADRVWITPSGRARLLDWAPAGDGDVAPPAFLRDIVRRSALGPLPLPAQALMKRLEGEPGGTMDALVQELATLVNEPPALSRGRRVAHLVIAIAPTMFMAGITLVTAVLLVWNESQAGPKADLTESLMRLNRLRDRADVTLVPGEERAFELYVAAHYAGIIKDERTWKEGWTMLRFTPTLRQSAESILSRYPDPPADEVRAAATIVEPYLQKERAKASRNLTVRGLAWIAGIFAAGLSVVLACIGLLSALLFRGGLALRLLGIAVATEHGEAGRVRAFWRAVIAWSPAALSALMLAVGNPGFSAPLFWLFIEAASLILFLVGTAYAVRNPDRGLQDRLAGTWLVPR